jgi:hypothetical protein
MVLLEELLPQETLHTPQIGYALAAGIYQSLGHTPIPLNGKIPFTEGLLGATAKVDSKKIESMKHQFPFANTGIKHDLTCAIDVDNYDGKTGNAELLELEAKLGPLPRAPYSTSRGPQNLSRQIWFRRENNDPMNGDPTSNIEVIWSGYRSSMVAPSVHPKTGSHVAWFDPETHKEIAPPSRDELPVLPPSWEAFLRRDRIPIEHQGMFDGDLSSWEKWLDDSEPTWYATEFLKNLQHLKHVGHNDLILQIREVHSLRDNLWERGVSKCLEALRKKYFETTNEANPEQEWSNAVKWVVGKNWEPSAVPQSTAREIAIRICEEVKQPPLQDFWNSRDSLRAIYKLGRQTFTAPTALLGVCIARALHTVPWNVHYRSFMSSAPLNTIIAIVGPTGTGKSLSGSILAENYIFPDADPRYPGANTWTGTISPGSGESIGDSYKKSVSHKAKDGTKSWTLVWRHPNRAAIFSFDEIGMLDRRDGRDGSTLLEYIKQGYSGTEIGRVLANGKGIELAPKTYRMATIINAQPERSASLFSDSAIAGGLSSRFLFVSTQDKNARLERDHTAKSPYYVKSINWVGIESINALPAMDAAHEAQQLQAIDGGVDPEISHQLLTRAKVAVALAVLDGRPYLIDEDWLLSGLVIQHSDETRLAIKSALAKAAGIATSRAGHAAGVKAAIAEETKSERQLKLKIKALEKHRETHPDKSDADFRRTVNKDLRPIVDQAASILGPRKQRSTST